MKKIIVPVDFSEHAGIICDYALEYARLFPSEILLYHTYFDQMVITEPGFAETMEVSPVLNEEMIREIHRQAERKIGELSSQLVSRIEREGISGVSVRTEVTGGSVDTEIKEVCHEYKPDLVVIGSRGAGKNVNFWGRISTYLVSHLTEPIMIIPHLDSFLGFRNVMVGIDLNLDNSSLINRILELLDTFRCRIYCVNFITGQKQEGSVQKMEMLKEQFAQRDILSEIQFEMVETGEDNQKAIGQFISDHDIRMIAFQPQKHGIFYKLFTSNITRRDLFATMLPLLAIPESR